MLPFFTRIRPTILPWLPHRLTASLLHRPATDRIYRFFLASPWLFMKALSSIINVCSAGLKLIFGRNRTFKTFSARNIALSPSPFLEDEEYMFENSKSTDNALLPNVECISAEFREANELIFSGNDISECMDREPSIAKNQTAEEDEMKTIKFIFTEYGWNIGSQSGYRIDLNQSNIMRILNDLYDESLDAALALYFFRWSESFTGSKHSIQSTCRMIHILVSGNMNYRAVDLTLHLVRNNGGEEDWHNLLLKVLHETHTERRVLQTVYSMLVDCYVKDNMTDIALKSTCQMKHLNIFPSIGVCNSLLRALLQSEKLELAWNLLEDMQSHGMSINASIISLFIYNYCSKGNPENGWKLLMEMKNLGIKPDVITYTIVIDSLCKMSRLKEATALLFKMTGMGISLDSVLISSVINCYCKERKLEEAIEVLNIFNLPPNVFVYNSFISRLCRDGNMVKASQFFHDMCELGLLPDCFSYTTIIGGYCKVRDKSKVFEFLGKMLKRGIKPTITTYTLLTDSCCKSGDMEMAENFFQIMIREGLVPDVIAYNTLMDGYGKKGHLQKTFELLNIMRSADISPDIVTYNTIIHSLIMRGFLNVAKDLLDELIRRGFSPDVVTFTNIIDGYSKKENLEEAFLVWLYMSEHCMKPDVVTCSALLNGYCRAHRIDEAIVLFRKMLDVGLNPDLVLYNTLIHGFCSVGNVDDACFLVNVMVKNCIIPNYITLRALILGFEKKWVRNPVQSATFELQKILQGYGIHVDVDQFLAMRQ